MNQNQKKLQMNQTLAVALSLLVVVAVCITAIAVGTAKKEKPPAQSSSSSTSRTTKSTSQTSQTTESTSQTEEKPNNPVVDEKITFVAPMTAGNIIKDWSADIPVFSVTMEDYRLHLGIDIAASAGTPVFAVADGTVESVTFHPMMGQTVVIVHKDGYKSVYQNMQTAVPSGITEGMEIKAGTQIGSVGDTALIEISEEPHLHFELYRDGNSENPLAHFSVTPVNANSDYED